MLSQWNIDMTDESLNNETTTLTVAPTPTHQQHEPMLNQSLASKKRTRSDFNQTHH